MGGLEAPVKHPWLWRGLVSAAALGLGLLYTSPSMPIVARQGLDWPVHFTGEQGSFATYGRWWLQGEGPWLGDGFSGQLPTFYSYLSDLLLNLLARLLDCPATTVQAALWGPLLGAALFVANYAVLAAVLRDRMCALLASLVISTARGSALLALVASPERRTEVVGLLHLPFDAVSLGTAQSLGWVLFLPSLGLFYLAYRDFTVGRAVAFGACTGLLLQAHTLTFLNAAAAQLLYLVATNLAERPDGRGKRAWLAALATIAVVFTGLVLFGFPVSPPVLALLGGIALLATFAVDPSKRVYLFGYGTAALVAAPYVLALALRYREALPSTASREAVSPAEILAFFAVYVLAAVPVFLTGGDAPPRRWATAVLLATLFLALNHSWGWGNHPYRFAIHLVFPLAVLSALGVRRSPRPLGGLLLAVLAAVSLVNLWSFARGERRYVVLADDGPDSASFLRAVRAATGRPEARDLSVLNPPEHEYPVDVAQNTVLFSYSLRPGFVPDFRYVLARERYFNRLGLFCFLVPGYPAFDKHLRRYACEEPLDPPREVVALRGRALRAAILPVYGIGYAAAPGRPFARFLKQAQADYGWEDVAGGPGRQRFLRTGAPARMGVARFARGRWDQRGLSVDLEVDTGGPHVVVLGGRRLAERADRVLLDGEALEARARSANWAVYEADIVRGAHRLELLWPERSAARDADYLYFAAVVAMSHAPGYLDLPEVRTRR